VHVEGREAATEYAMAWVNAFQDAKLNVHHEIATDEWVVQEFVFEGTHTGTLSTPAGEIPPTNRTLRGRGVQIFRVDGETVIDTRLYFDQVQVMSQLGLMPEPAAATS
jgi:predicted ester cyclase